jgi:hypothetical protein
MGIFGSGDPAHSVVITNAAIQTAPYDPALYYMDPGEPDPSQIRRWDFYHTLIDDGMTSTIEIITQTCHLVDVGDISYFNVQSAGSSIQMVYWIANIRPDEYVGVYVADNPAGPAQLIEFSVGETPIDEGIWEDVYRFSGTYYYFLNYESWLPDAANPSLLFPGNGNPVTESPAKPAWFT